MKHHTPYEIRIDWTWSREEGALVVLLLPAPPLPSALAWTAAAMAALSSALMEAFIRLTLRRRSPRSLRLLWALSETPGAVTPSFNKRARMNQGSLGM